MADLLPPTLWMLGSRDALVPRGVAQALPQLQPGAEVKLLDKAAHALFLSHPQACCRLIQDFLDEN